MVNPVPGRSITTPFKKKGSSWSTGEHSGVDWACPTGTVVVAPWGGRVIAAGSGGAGWGSAYGNAVVIDFDKLPDGSPGLWGILAHLSKVEVKGGQRIEAGQRIGLSGSTGNSTGPHVHFEIQPQSRWVRGSYRDPAAHISAGGAKPDQTSSGGPYVTKNIYTDRVGYGQMDSDTVKELQERLNRISLKGGKNLPITGNYLDQTDQEVRLWQQQVCGDTPDLPQKSYLGPKQLKRMFTSPPYTIHDRGLPEVAKGNSPAPNPSPSPAPDISQTKWFVPASLAVLRNEVNSKWPNRDKSSDGTIGDILHSQSKSEHNPVGHKFGPEFGTPGAVHAMDITVAGLDVDELLKALIGDSRVWYVIHNGKIWSKTYKWAERPYSGSDPHIKHVHLSLAADDQISAVRNEIDDSLWFDSESDAPKLPEALEKFIESNIAPILIIGTVVVIALILLAAI